MKKGIFSCVLLLLLVVYGTIAYRHYGASDRVPEGGQSDAPPPRALVAGGGADAVRILGIGNSFTVDALNSYLWELAVADDRALVVGSLTIGGATLEEHADNADGDLALYQYDKRNWDGTVVRAGGKRIADALADEPWDYLCFQQQSWLAGQYASYEAYLPVLVAYAKSKSRNPATVYAVLQTWAFAGDYANVDYEYYGSDQIRMYRSLVDAVERSVVLVAPKMMVIPAGTAIQNGRTSEVGDAFCRDGYHLNAGLGRFTVACTFYEAIFGDDVTRNPYRPGNMPEHHAKIAKRAAHAAVRTPNEVTELREYVPGSD